jgi:DNA processing protein
MITAGAALQYNREVMAVPGKIDSPLSKGPHQLLKDGAKLVEYVEDVMEALGYIGEQLEDYASAAAAKALQKIDAPLFDISRLKLGTDEKMIYDYLGKEPFHIEQIIAGTNLAAGSINAGLVSLQLKGLIKQLPGSFFLRN